MANKDSFPPIIIIGMHRSGTTMITEILEQLGLFVGAQKEANNEATFFLKLNDWMLRQAGGAWDNPEPAHFLLNNTEVRTIFVDYLKYIFNTYWALEYFGFKRFFRGERFFNLKEPWGWKDPRSTIMLPIWLDLFPEAKVIHVYRNGIDVANSLKIRAEKKLEIGTCKHEGRKKRKLYWLKKKEAGFTHSLRVLQLEGGVALWEQYMEIAEDEVSRLGQNAISVKYEDFICHPDEHIKKLVNFCGLNVSAQEIGELSKKVDKTRAFAFHQKPELKALYATHSNLLQKYGY